MSEIVIALLLLVPLCLVVLILNNSRKKQKENVQDKIAAYIKQVSDQLELKQSFQKQLVHQTVVLDEEKRKLLVIDHQDNLTHQVHNIDGIKTFKVLKIQNAIAGEKKQKDDIITTQIVVTIGFEKGDLTSLLVLYDHVVHNIFQMAELETEAKQLKEKLSSVKEGKMIEA